MIAKDVPYSSTPIRIKMMSGRDDADCVARQCSPCHDLDLGICFWAPSVVEGE